MTHGWERLRMPMEKCARGGPRPGAGRPTNKVKKIATKQRITLFLAKQSITRLKLSSDRAGLPVAEVIMRLVELHLDDYNLSLK